MLRLAALGAFLLLASAGAIARAETRQDGIAAFWSGDYAKALDLLEPLATKGDLSAETIVGGMYIGGLGVAKDCGRGEPLVLRAAEAGYPRAQYFMGRIYASGSCSEENDREAFKWFRKAARQRDPDAAFSVGLLFAEGQAVPTDFTEAYCWFQASLSYFDSAYHMIPLEPHTPFLRNKEAAERNVRVLRSSLPLTDRKKADTLFCTTE